MRKGRWEAVLSYGILRKTSVSRRQADFYSVRAGQRLVRRLAHRCRLRHGVAACNWTLCSSAPPDPPHRRSIVYFSRKTLGLSAFCRCAVLFDVLRLWLCWPELVLCARMSCGRRLSRSPGGHGQRRSGNACGSVDCRPHRSAGRSFQYCLFRALPRRTVGLPPRGSIPALAPACAYAVLGESPPRFHRRTRCHRRLPAD